MHLLLVNPDLSVADAVAGFDEPGWTVTAAGDYGAALEAAEKHDFDVVLLADPGARETDPERKAAFERLLRLIEQRRIAGVLTTDHPERIDVNPNSLLDPIDRKVSPAELRGRLATIARYQRVVGRLENELGNLERMGRQLQRHFRAVDQEMRLDSRLQRDFLPKVDEAIGGVRFATVYKPASWVSGDIYDVFRVDEKHVGFYVADAVGHGMAASLLTLFIKRCLTPKRIEADGYTVLCPSEAIAVLNDGLAEQALPNCQFVTACYGVLNTETLCFRYARGGHPYPVLLSSAGALRELKTGGGLLGLFRGEEFPVMETQLRPGERVIFYTDGFECLVDVAASNESKPYHLRTFESLAHLPIDEMMRRISARLDNESGSLDPKDDVTIVAMEVPEPVAND